MGQGRPIALAESPLRNLVISFVFVFMEESIWLGSYAGIGGFSSLKGVQILGNCVLPRELGQVKSRGLQGSAVNDIRHDRKGKERKRLFVLLFCFVVYFYDRF